MNGRWTRYILRGLIRSVVFAAVVVCILALAEELPWSAAKYTLILTGLIVWPASIYVDYINDELAKVIRGQERRLEELLTR